jgi:hypothetical protein
MSEKNSVKISRRKAKDKEFGLLASEQPKVKPKLKRPKPRIQDSIVIDSELGLVFTSEEEMLDFFNPLIQTLVQQYESFQDKKEVLPSSLNHINDLLDQCLDDPDEVWMLPEVGFSLKAPKQKKILSNKENSSVEEDNLSVFAFIRYHEKEKLHHIALAHVNSEDDPTFVYAQFLTGNGKILEHYRKGRMVYDQSLSEIEFGMLEGDALSEGDPLAVGLFQAMLKLRLDIDVNQTQFEILGKECRDRTIEEADEIWRSQDSSGQILVTFIREFPDHSIKDLFYIVVTQQELNSGIHALLFSFPTQDESLVERYRYGENLHAEEVAQESSH